MKKIKSHSSKVYHVTTGAKTVSPWGGKIDAIFCGAKNLHHGLTVENADGLTMCSRCEAAMAKRGVKLEEQTPVEAPAAEAPVEIPATPSKAPMPVAGQVWSNGRLTWVVDTVEAGRVTFHAPSKHGFVDQDTISILTFRKRAVDLGLKPVEPIDPKDSPKTEVAQAAPAPSTDSEAKPMTPGYWFRAKVRFTTQEVTPVYSRRSASMFLPGQNRWASVDPKTARYWIDNDLADLADAPNIPE